MAAVRLKALSLAQIAARLDDRFNLLTGGNRAALPRQQTLRAAMDWSYELLTSPEQQLFRRLSVFVGGFTLAAAEAMCSPQFPAPTPKLVEAGGSNVEVLDVLSRLVDKSLVIVEHQAGTVRYRMLETVREYGQDKLWVLGEEAEARRRHLLWCQTFAEHAEAGLIGPTQASWLQQLEADHANISHALRWAAQSSEAEDVATGLRLGSALWQFWGYRSYINEGHEWLTQLLALPHARGSALVEARAQALSTAGMLATRQTDYTAATQWLEESIQLWRTVGQVRDLSFALHHRGWLATSLGEFAQARRYYAESLVLRRSLGQNGQRAVAETLTYMGLLAYLKGDFSEARALQQEALTIKRQLGEVWTLAFSHWNLGIIAFAQGDHAAAHAIYREALTALQKFGGRWGMPFVLEGIAYLALSEGQLERGILLCGAAATLREQAGVVIPPVLRELHERQLINARQQLNDDALAVVLNEGRAMPLAQVIELALTL